MKGQEVWICQAGTICKAWELGKAQCHAMRLRTDASAVKSFHLREYNPKGEAKSTTKTGRDQTIRQTDQSR